MGKEKENSENTSFWEKYKIIFTFPVWSYLKPLIDYYNTLREGSMKDEKFCLEVRSKICILMEKVDLYYIAISFIFALNIIFIMFSEFIKCKKNFLLSGLTLCGTFLVVWLLGINFVKKFRNLLIKVDDNSYLDKLYPSTESVTKKFLKFIDNCLFIFYKCLWVILMIFSGAFFYFSQENFCNFWKWIFYYITIFIVWLIYCEGRYVLNKVAVVIALPVDILCTYKNSAGNLDNIF